MIDHLTVRVGDRDAVVPVYRTLLGTLGIEPDHTDPRFPEWGDWSFQQADDEHPVTRGLHVGFAAPSREAVDAFHAAGLAAGWEDDGAPGLRPQYLEDYYGGFLRDPDGNSIEAVHHGTVRTNGIVDHLWLRTRDLAAMRVFYLAIAGPAGLTVGIDTPDHLLLRAGGGSVSFVPGDVASSGVHLAFSADEPGPVDAFHAAALRAGGRDNGPPGERAIYHRGYHGAFVLDPDGHNIEVVHHGRPDA